MYNLTPNGDTIFFLDFDGPLLPAKLHYELFNATVLLNDEALTWQDCHVTKTKIRFDPVMINVLNMWMDNVENAKLVISSHWSKYATFDQLLQYLSNNGFRHSDKLHKNWTTTKIKSWTRADEIAHWLFDNHGTYSNYIILEDDDSVLNDERILKNKVLLIDFLNGIQFNQIFEGCEILCLTDYNEAKKSITDF